jgi:hypothetical protein
MIGYNPPSHEIHADKWHNATDRQTDGIATMYVATLLVCHALEAMIAALLAGILLLFDIHAGAVQEWLL